MPPVPSLLRDIPMFADLSDRHLDRLAGLAEPLVLASGQRLFRAGDAADAFYVLVSGEIALLEADTVRFRLRPVSVIGELGGITGLARNTDAVAQAPSELWRMPGAKVRSYFRDDPALGLAFHESLLRIVAEKARRDQHRLEDMRGHIIRTQKAMKQMRELVLESPDSPVSEQLHGILDRQIRTGRRVNYRIEPNTMLPADVHLDDGSRAEIEEISRTKATLRFPGEAPPRASPWSGVLRLPGQVEFPLGGTVVSSTGRTAEIEFDGLIDEYVEELEEYLTRVQMLEFVV